MPEVHGEVFKERDTTTQTKMSNYTVPAIAAPDPQARRYAISWVLCLIFYFLEYASRSTSGVMVPELAKAFGTTAVGIGTLLGVYYYTYSVTSLIAGASLDRLGAKLAVPFGLLLFGIGCILFRVPDIAVGYVGRLLQGAGSAFAFTGSVYVASRGLPARWLGTAIGSTQCLGMVGGFVGDFAVGPGMQRGISWQAVWWILGIAGLGVGLLLFVVTPSAENSRSAGKGGGTILSPYGIVLRNPQSYLCGAISGLLFVPTTIGAMTWGVVLFQRDRGLTYSAAVVAASMVPLGWAVGSPLLGWLADSLKRRKPVLMFGALLMFIMMAQMAYLPHLMTIAVSCFFFGVASGSAMIPYTIMKEVNPDKVKGSATGAMNFITFGISALIGPLFGKFAGERYLGFGNTQQHFRFTVLFWMAGIALALLLSVALRETGRARVDA